MYLSTNEMKAGRIRPLNLILWSAFLTGMILLSFQNYLLFHSLAELFSIIIAFMMFAIAINTGRFAGANSAFLTFLGLSYGIVGGFDLLHTLAYKGMGVFPNNTANMATELWIIARYLQSAALLIASILFNRQTNIRRIIQAFVVVAMLLFAAVFVFDRFPDCFIEGYGLTDFKKISEVIISLILSASAILLFKKRKSLKDNAYWLLILSVMLTIMSELVFILYVDVSGIPNIIGHMLKLAAFYFVYKAVVEVNLLNPFIELARSERRSANLIESLPESVLIYEDRSVVFANTAAARLFGADGIQGDLIDLLDLDVKNFPNNTEQLAGRRIKRPDGSEAQVEIKVLPFTYQDRAASLAIVYDVTERNAAEQVMVRNAELQIEADLLRQKEQEYLEILNGSTEASWIHDNTTDLLVYSHEWKQRIGGEHVPDEEMIRYATSLVHPDDIDRVVKERKSIFDNRLSKYATEYRFRIVSGEYIWVYDQGKIIYNDEGAPVKTYGTSMDITKRKTSEEELKQADRNKNEFLHTLSHELRNPLAAIVAGFSLLNLTDDPKKSARAKSIIQRQIAQLTRLVDDMLDITRITNNKIKLQKKQIDLVSLVASVAEDYHLLMDGKGINFEVNLDSQPITIDADPARIRQIIGNLLQNAAKFTDRGGSVTLSVSRDQQEGVIQVQDSGIGIQPEFLDQMFVPFQQVSSSHNRNEGGLGLGLSIVKSIVELHGGNAQVFSEGLEKGATFIIRLPA